MSGLEIAGLVVGAIPLLVGGLEVYSRGIATSRRFFRYRQEVKDLLMQLKTEQVMLVNSLNILLVGVFRPQEMPRFLSNPSAERWRDPKFDTKLRSRLCSSYEVYLENIMAIDVVVDGFKKKLKLDASGKPAFTEPSKFKANYKRLKFSLKKSEYDELMSKLRQANQSLHRLTTQTQALSSLQTSTKSNPRRVPKFKAINACAKGFHSALSSGWKCPCRADHRVNLRLEHRLNENDISSDEDEDEDEELVFGGNSLRVLFCYNSQPAKNGKSRLAPWAWEEVDIRLKPKEANKPKVAAGAFCASNKVGVRFETLEKEAAKLTLKLETSLVPIHNLCNAISTFQKPLLAAEYAKQNVLIYPLNEPSPNHKSRDVVSLSTVLNATALTREKRLLLGVILASSILQLYQTPWLDNNWDSSSVLFVKDHKRTVYDNPFVTWGSTDHLQGPDMSSPIARTIRNWPLFRLGVVLIELWYGKPLDEITKPDGSQINMSMPSPILDWHRADCLVDELYTEAGKKYSDAVRRCIRCSFDTRVTSLDDRAFQKAVYEGVVAQLKENLDFLY